MIMHQKTISGFLFSLLILPLGLFSAPQESDVVKLPKMSVSTWVPVQRVGEHHMVEPRFGAAAVVVEGKVYVIGGQDDEGVVSDTVECFDPDTGSSKIVAKLKRARFFHGVAAVGSRIFIIGGQNNQRYRGTERTMMVPFDVEPSVEIYDTKTGEMGAGPRMLSPRASFGCVAVGNLVYAIGGDTEDRRCSRRMEVLDTTTLTWAELPPMPTIRSAPAVVVPGDFIVMAGGFDGRTARREVEAFNTKTKTWHVQAPLEKDISAHCLVFYRKHLLAFGDYAQTNVITSYNLATKTTEQFELKYTPARHATAVGIGDKIYIFGGRIGRQSPGMNLIQVFECVTGKAENPKGTAK